VFNGHTVHRPKQISGYMQISMTIYNKHEDVIVTFLWH